MKNKLFLIICLLVVAAMMLASCSTAAEITEAPVVEEPEATNACATFKEELNFVYVTPSTESGYWGSYVLIGIENAVKDIEAKYGVKVNLEVQGPTAENMVDQFMSTLEAVIAQKPDGILLGQLNPDAVAPLVKDATAQGIRVNLISIGVPLEPQEYGALFYCDQPQQGEFAAQAYMDAVKAKGLAEDGTTAMHMSVVVPILEEKLNNFRTTLQGLAPNMTILDTQYNENDVNKGITLMQDQLATYGDDLVGFFAGNNVTGNAVARVIEESGKSDQLVGVAIDSDPAEIDALKNGFLDALIVQTPYEQAYQATMDIAMFLLECKDPNTQDVNIPAVTITKANMDTPEMQALLDPTILKK